MGVQKKATEIFTDVISTGGDSITVKARMKASPGLESDDVATIAQLNDLSNQLSDRIERPDFPVVPGDLTVNWQTDIVPGMTKTYARVFGNRPRKALMEGMDGSGIFTPYESNITYTKNAEGNPDQLTISNIFYPGNATII